MAYKRNPMRCERICGLGRHLANLSKDCSDTYAAQWFEVSLSEPIPKRNNAYSAKRTLDDSAIRRIDLPHLFLCADAIMLTLDNVVSGLVVYPARINARLMEELPFMATENIIMRLVTRGISRQEAHEQIRVLSHQASDVVKKEGKPNDLIDRIKKTEFFAPIKDEIDEMLDAKNFVGRCPEQVVRYCQDPEGEVQVALRPYRKYIEASKVVDLSV